MIDLFERILSPNPPPFALLYRPERAGAGTLDVIIGELSAPQTIADIPLRDGPLPTGQDVLVVMPYRQIAERGFAVSDDGTPLVAMSVAAHGCLSVAEALARIPEVAIQLTDGHFDLDDGAYSVVVQKIIDDEIGTGEGSNFVIKRSFITDIVDYTPAAALTFFSRLLRNETGAYWTFLVHTGDRTLVGASPERHISVQDGIAVMNPISGTLRYPAAGPDLPGVLDFLADRKEADELYMVVDEELKMMTRICDGNLRVVGPYLKEMAKLAHTEYFIEGRTCRDPREVLRETMFAPTVTGSPLESACRVISRYEPQGRGYYGGVVALIGADDHGRRSLDSAILIRTADIDATGRTSIGVGATFVRHSDPAGEAAETRAKAAGLLSNLATPTRFAQHPSVRESLDQRNATISAFWLGDHAAASPMLAGMDVLVVDAEDTFTNMLARQLDALGCTVTVRRFDEPYTLGDFDLVVMGPGPGDPRQTEHPKIARLRGDIGWLLAHRRPFLAVCLSHQVLCTQLGLPLVRRDSPNQGVQRQVELFGAQEFVGFYNTFNARCPDRIVPYGPDEAVELSRDEETGDVHALRGPFFASMQFHAESVLTRDGVRIIGTTLDGILQRSAPGQRSKADAPCVR